MVLFDGKEISKAWGLSLSKDGTATQSSNAWTPWYTKLRRLVKFDSLRVRALIMLIEAEDRHSRLTPEAIDLLERMLEGRADKTELHKTT